MDFFPTLPPHVTPDIDKGSFHFVQAHHMTNSLIRTQSWYEIRGANTGFSTTHYTILDNGAFELGTADADALFNIAGIIRPSEVVCPDAFQDADQTMEMLVKHLHDCLEAAPAIMIVPQGKDLIEWCQCVRNMYAFCSGVWDSRIVLGIPKVVDTYTGGRWCACAWLEDVGIVPGGGVHLLGGWYGLYHLGELGRQFPFIRSLDTTLPYAYAKKGKILYDKACGKIDMESEWWDEPTSEQEIILAQINIASCRKLLEGGG